MIERGSEHHQPIARHSPVRRHQSRELPQIRCWLPDRTPPCPCPTRPLPVLPQRPPPVPPLDPPGTRSRPSSGFRTGPYAEFSFELPMANSAAIRLAKHHCARVFQTLDRGRIIRRNNFLQDCSIHSRSHASRVINVCRRNQHPCIAAALFHSRHSTSILPACANARLARQRQVNIQFCVALLDPSIKSRASSRAEIFFEDRRKLLRDLAARPVGRHHRLNHLAALEKTVWPLPGACADRLAYQHRSSTSSLNSEWTLLTPLPSSCALNPCA